MKSVFNKRSLALTLMLAFGAPMVAEAQVFFRVPDLLRDQFKKSEKVDFIRVLPTGAPRKAIETKLGYKLKTTAYVVYVARSHGSVDGYAIFDSQVGLHEAIDFATFFDPAGDITRVEIVAYREPYGDEIRSKRFRQQFLGRNGSSGFRTSRDIDIVSGATLSAQAMAKAVRRAAVLLQTTVLHPAEPKTKTAVAGKLAAK